MTWRPPECDHPNMVRLQEANWVYGQQAWTHDQWHCRDCGGTWADQVSQPANFPDGWAAGVSWR